MSGEWKQTTLGQACRDGRGDTQTGPFRSQLHQSDYVVEGVGGTPYLISFVSASKVRISGPNRL